MNASYYGPCFCCLSYCTFLLYSIDPLSVISYDTCRIMTNTRKNWYIRFKQRPKSIVIHNISWWDTFRCFLNNFNESPVFGKTYHRYDWVTCAFYPVIKKKIMLTNMKQPDSWLILLLYPGEFYTHEIGSLIIIIIIVLVIIIIYI